MATSFRFPASYTILAGLAGAIAWSIPYLIVPFIPRFPTYESPPYHIHLTELTIGYSVAGVMAGGLFLIGLGLLPIDRERYSRPVLSFAAVLATLMGMAVGGAFASVFGFGVGFSQPGYSLMASLGVLDNALDKGPEPFLSIGLIIGAGLAVIILLLFSGIMTQLALSRSSPVLSTLEVALKASGMALVGRVFICIVEFSSFAEYTAVGQSLIFLFLVPATGGALFGALAWYFCSRLKAA